LRREEWEAVVGGSGLRKLGVLVHRDRLNDAVMMFGQCAKTEVLSIDETVALSRAHGIHVVPVTGDGGGVIGAWAAMGLRAGSNDGRFLRLPGLRELPGVHTAAGLAR